MPANGTSSRIVIDGTKFTRLNGFRQSPVYGDGIIASPPRPNASGMPSNAMYLFQNQYRDFAFQKVSPPEYGNDDSIARITGLAANEPDYIADYHFISLMRIMDRLIDPQYSGYIGGDFNSPEPTD